MSCQFYRKRLLISQARLYQECSPTLQKELEEEHGHFGDTVQADFIDSYENLSLKGVLGLNWVTHHCPQVRFVFKMDDDVFVDTSKLLHRYWPLFVGKTRTMVDNSLFPHMDFFPFHYCSGLVVLMTGDLIPFLYQATMFTPVFWIDDIFLFGILPWVSGNVTMYNFGAKKYLVFYAPIMVECLKKSGFDCRLLAAHATMPVDMFDEMWNLTLTVHDLQAQAIDVHRIA
nr:hypothetical protein BaRGS_029945 [Batillaria attramentaria]